MRDGLTLRGAVAAALIAAQVASGQWDEPPTELVASDAAASDQFGKSVATTGEVVVVGAPYCDQAGADAGAAFVCRSLNGPWVEEQTLLAPDGAAGDQFGRAVCVSDDVAVVGAPYDDGPGSNSGSAYVFRYDGSGWALEQKLLAADGAAGDRFGNSVSISGAAVIVGASMNNGGAGTAYVFRYNGSAWTQESLILPPAGAGTAFGASVSIHGDLAVVGNPGNGWAGVGSGAAYAYARNGSTWLLDQMLAASDGQAGDAFGTAVAAGAGLVAVGAMYEDELGGDAGAAYAFRLSGGDWYQEAKITASDGAALSEFGCNLALSGERLAVGAQNDGAGIGAAYVFGHYGAFWVEEAKLVNPFPWDDDYFGNAVAFTAGVLVVGTAQNNSAAGVDSGAAYAFEDGGVPPDGDGDGLPDPFDNCPAHPNDDQADCDGDGIGDVCGIAGGVSTDCNGNGVPDECDLAAGTSADLDGSGVPDECEIDCNGNGAPDVQDIASGASSDCNGNGVPDECDGSALYVLGSGPLGPIGAGSPQSFTIDSAAMALDDVTLSFTASADLGSSAEFITASLNGTNLGVLWGSGGLDCANPPDQAQLVVTQDAFNAVIISGQDVVITMTPSSGVSPTQCPAGFISVTVSYTGTAMNDADGDGVPDECEGQGCPADLDGDGAVGVGDLLVLLAAWNGAPGTPADLNGSGTVDVADLLLLLGIWGLCP